MSLLQPAFRLLALLSNIWRKALSVWGGNAFFSSLMAVPISFLFRMSLNQVTCLLAVEVFFPIRIKCRNILARYFIVSSTKNVNFK
jgi:hypothetical protein